MSSIQKSVVRPHIDIVSPIQKSVVRDQILDGESACSAMTATTSMLTLVVAIYIANSIVVCSIAILATILVRILSNFITSITIPQARILSTTPDLCPPY